MKKNDFRARFRALPLLALAFSASGCTEGAFKDVLFETYIIKLSAEPAEVAMLVDEIATAYGIQPLHVYENVTQGFQVDLPFGLLEEIEGIEGVEYVVVDEPGDYLPPEDEEEPTFTEDEIPEGILRIGGPYVGDLSGVFVAVVDTGADLDHPDLNIVAGVDIVGEANGNDNGGQDGNGHGTHVAGTIGAIGDGSGVVGVAPGVGIHAVRVLDNSGSGTFGDIIAGLEYVSRNPEIKIVNMSLGGPGSAGTNNPLAEAIQSLEDSGVVVCIAAGNEGADTATTIPAAYDLGIVVSAYNARGGSDRGFADFSNYGDAVDITAPGVGITSTYPDNDYTALSGTSMATPHVAGAIAAYFAEQGTSSPAAVRNVLINNGENGMEGQSGRHTEPMLDLEAILESR